MRLTKVTFIITLAVVLAVTLSAADYHQVGTAGSGRAASSNLRLESVLGQNTGGVSGDLTSGFLTTISRTSFVPGDADGSGDIDISDVVFLITYIFAEGAAPNPLQAGDADCSGGIDISDAVFLVIYIFGNGSAPHNCL